MAEPELAEERLEPPSHAKRWGYSGRWGGAAASAALLGLLAIGSAYYGRLGFPRGQGGNGLTNLVDPALYQADDPLRAEAAELANRLGRDFPDDVYVLFIRGLILNKCVSRDEAAECWRECIRRAPDFGEPYCWLGKELFKRGQFEQAVECLRKAVELRTPVPDARVQLADALINLGRPGEAIPVLEEQVRVAPEVIAGVFYLGQAYALVGRTDEAVQYYRRALDLNPDCYQAWHGLATISQKRGESEKAREYFEKCNKLQAAFHAGHQAERRESGEADSLERAVANAYTDAGRIYLARNNPTSAEVCWSRAAAIDPRHAASRASLADLYGQQGRLEPMLALFEELRGIEPDNPLHSFQLGMLHMRMRHFDQAEEAFRRCIELAPERAEGHAALAELYVRSGRKLPEAADLARKAVQIEPVAGNYYLLSEACDASGDRPAAVAAIARAVELDPGNPAYRQAQDRLRGSSAPAEPRSD